MILCALVLIPRQHPAALGLELIIAALLIGSLLLRTGSRDRPAERSRLGELLDRRATLLTISAFVLAAAISHWCGGGGGLYWLVPAILIAFVSGMVNAWLFLLGDADATNEGS